jgi:hypothetical protein
MKNYIVEVPTLVNVIRILSRIRLPFFPYWYLVEYYLAESGILQNSIQHILTLYILLSDKLFKTEKQYLKVIVNLQVVLY